MNANQKSKAQEQWPSARQNELSLKIIAVWSFAYIILSVGWIAWELLNL